MCRKKKKVARYALDHKMVQPPSGEQRVAAAPPRYAVEASMPKQWRCTMPSRGYRKGISDTKRSRPEIIKARTAKETKDALHAEADSRSITFSEMVDLILNAHASGTRLAAPQTRGINSAALRELARLGNNLNQIARQAHLMRLSLIERETLTLLSTINETARRISA